MCKCTPNIRTPYCGRPGCEYPVTDNSLTYFDFSRNKHSIDPREVIGIESEPGGSCIMVTRGGLRLQNISRPEVAKAEIASCLKKLIPIDDIKAENRLLKIALGYHLNADAYGSTFPENEADRKSLRQSETWNRLYARSLLSSTLAAECNHLMKEHAAIAEIGKN